MMADKTTKKQNKAAQRADMTAAIEQAKLAIVAYQSGAWKAVCQITAAAVKAHYLFNVSTDQALGRTRKPFEVNKGNKVYADWLTALRKGEYVNENTAKRWFSSAARIIAELQGELSAISEAPAQSPDGKVLSAADMVASLIKAKKGWTTQDALVRDTTEKGQSGRPENVAAESDGAGTGNATDEGEAEGDEGEAPEQFNAAPVTNPSVTFAAILENVETGRFSHEQIYTLLSALTLAWGRVPADKQAKIAAAVEAAKRAPVAMVEADLAAAA